MEIIYRPLADLVTHPKNPRKDTPEKIAELAESIKANPKFFEARPILLSDRTGELVIIGGERRSKAARLLEMVDAPTILIPGLTEEQEEEILIRDNTHSGTWDVDALVKWDADRLEKWDVPSGVLGRHEGGVDIGGLFDPNKEAPVKPKPTIIEIVVPLGMEDVIEDVRAAIFNAIEEFEGVHLV